MTQSLYIQETAASALTVNLLTGALKLTTDGWSTLTSEEQVWETFNCVSIADAATLAGVLNDLDKLRERVRIYKADSTNSNPIWLIVRSEGDSGVRRALVYDIQYEIIGQYDRTPLLRATGNATFVTVTVLRHQYYEPAASAQHTQSGIGVVGGKWSIAISNDSSAQNRIEKLTVQADGASPMSRIWIGIREHNFGTTGFVPLWEAEHGVPIGSTDTTEGADATASGGNKDTISFATHPEMLNRFTITWDNVATANGISSGDYSDMMGNYLVLARMKVNAAGTKVRAQLRGGWAGFLGKESVFGTVYISGETNWKLFEMGRISFPTTGGRGGWYGTTSDLGDFQFVFFAQRDSVAGSLDVDCFILIPTDHLFYCDGASASSSSDLTAYIYEDESQYAICENGATVWGNIEFGFENWNVSPAGGILVAAAQTATSHLLTPTLYVTLDVYARWRGYYA